jgi:hypothetical protein
MTDATRDFEPGLAINLASATHGPTFAEVVSNVANAPIVAAAGAGTNLYITSLRASIATVPGSATSTLITFKEGLTARCAGYVSENGGVWSIDFNPPWKLPNNTGLNAISSIGLVEGAGAIVSVMFASALS